MEQIEWSLVRLVIFDLDGTLYSQRCIRRRMLWELGLHCFRHPSELASLEVIAEFRRARERLADEGVEGIRELQYQRPASKLGIAPEEVAEVIRVWIEERPLRHLRRCRSTAVEELFERLRGSGKKIAIFSDYPVQAKVRVLGLNPDFIAASDDSEIDRLKPHPAGLEYLMSHSGFAPEQCLMIGDREDRDGACARRAGMRYLIKTRSPRASHHFCGFGELLPGLVGVE
jgi:phosphoglycolate phosphatase/putative hydrolase of the HAD superfamily